MLTSRSTSTIENALSRWRVDSIIMCPLVGTACNIHIAWIHTKNATIIQESDGVTTAYVIFGFSGRCTPASNRVDFVQVVLRNRFLWKGRRMLATGVSPVYAVGNQKIQVISLVARSWILNIIGGRQHHNRSKFCFMLDTVYGN